jgi:hypothetical protein
MAEKKFPVGPVPRATLGKGFAESFGPSAKPGFPVVSPSKMNFFLKCCHILLASSL